MNFNSCESYNPPIKPNKGRGFFRKVYENLLENQKPKFNTDLSFRTNEASKIVKKICDDDEWEISESHTVDSNANYKVNNNMVEDDWIGNDTNLSKSYDESDTNKTIIWNAIGSKNDSWTENNFNQKDNSILDFVREKKKDVEYQNWNPDDSESFNFSNNEKKVEGKSCNCFKCDKKGHISRDCLNNFSYSSNKSSFVSESKSKEKNCFKCGKNGHFARKCNENEFNNHRKDYKFCQNINSENNSWKKQHSSINARIYNDNFFKLKENFSDLEERPKVPIYKPPEVTEDDESLFVGISAGINFERYDKIKINVTGNKPPKPIETFEQIIKNPSLLSIIAKCGFSKPTPVQKYSIPIIMAKRNLMACAQTGSGKTLAFILPILQDLISETLPNNYGNKIQEPLVLIISPTRELVTQIYIEAFKFSKGLVKCQQIYGGASGGYQISQLSKGAHLLVATPGRLLDFLNRKLINFNSLRYLILDEADRLIDQGFIPKIREIVSHTTMPSKENRQTLMYSATFPDEVQRLANEFLAEGYLFLAVGTVGAANADVIQTLLKVDKFSKRNKLVEILGSTDLNDRTIIFVETKKTADFLASFLSQSNYKATSIHGNRYQCQREEALKDFKNGKFPILVATSVASRGLDIKDVCHVINYDLPKEGEDYIHRIGRTGRVGNIGKATSFYDSDVNKPLAGFLLKVLNDASQVVPEWLKEEASNESFFADYEVGGADIRDNQNGFYASSFYNDNNSAVEEIWN